MSLLPLVRHLVETERYPALIFFFSRSRVEEEARLLAQEAVFLREEDAQYVQDYLAARVPAEIRSLHQNLWQCLSKGVGYHHAGLAPTAKQMVEELFEQGYLPFVFCTETFALGVNFPARTVVLGSSSKRDDEGFRPLYNREILQITGRAGRRGTDERGYAYFLVDPDFPEEVPLTPPREPEPVESRFVVSPQLVLRLAPVYVGRHERLEELLRRSFRAYQLSWTVQKRFEWQKMLEETKRQLQQLESENQCTSDHQTCPHWRRPKEAELKRLEEEWRELKNTPRRGRKAERRQRELEQRWRNLRQTLAPSPVSCHYLEQVQKGRACPIYSGLRGLRRKYHKIKANLDALPDPTGELVQAFRHMENLLQEYGFLTADSQLTPKGQFARQVGPGGILLGEALWTGQIDGLAAAEIAALAGGVLLEDDPEPEFSGVLPPWAKPVFLQARAFQKAGLPTGFDRSALRPLLVWAQTGSLDLVWHKAALPPGDLVMLARRAAEVLKEAGGNLSLIGRWDLEAVFKEAYALVWQGEVARL